MGKKTGVWLAVAAAAVVALTTNVSGVNGNTPCEPSKWKLPVDARYNTEGKIDPDKLNVHLIPHSHDDPGWLMGVDQYYMERVQFILDTAVEELLKDPNRKFMFVEQSFFQRWWRQQSAETQAIVKDLVKKGQLDLSVNGGWCMHDEATPHYTAMVDQTAYGHQLLLEEFNVTPRIGWQIDPFGHSATQGSLLSGGVGFDALYFARIDYQDYGKRMREKNMEFIWRPSKSRGKSMQVFTGEIIDHYGAPGKYNYGNSNNEIQDDPSLHDFNVCDQVDAFVKNALGRGAASKGNHIFIPMGDDFAYDNARRWFKNIDKLLHYVNQDNRVNVLYSNLSYYTDLKRAEGLTWSVKTDDFFPYGSDKHAYWSGYFTSRPALKRFTRVANGLLQQARQIDAIYQSHHSATLDSLKRAVGLVQHHDGLSGTEKQSVADDYALRINDGILEAQKELNEILFVIGEKEPYELCLLTNVSICNVSTKQERFEVLVHNALPRKSVQSISVPITRKNVEIQVLSGDAIIRHQEVFSALPVHPENQDTPYSLVFSTELKALQTARFLITQKGGHDFEDYTTNGPDEYATDSVTLENEFVKALIDTKTGSITSLTNKRKNIKIPLSLNVAYYQAYQGEHEQRSGAYVFRPDSKKVYSVTGESNPSLTLVALETRRQDSGPSRVAFKVGKWVTLEYRINDNDEFVEIEWTVGSIPIEDKIGKEVILRFDTKKAIQSASTWYTDSNGLEFATRVRNHRDTWNLTLHDDQEFVAANYFPITTGAYIKDSKHQLNIVTDRAQGCASLEDGQLEVMVHRRLLADDAKGVAENLNETESVYDPVTKKTVTKGLVARGNFFINVDSADDGMKSIRSKMEAQFFQPLVLFRKPVQSSPAGVDGKVPWLTVNEFPENVGLTTLEELTKQCVMVRLSHLYAVDEHSTLSKSVAFDFTKFFEVKKSSISEVTELTLTGVAPKTDRSGYIDWKTNDDNENGVEGSEPIPVMGTQVELQAMEVRTFRVCFNKGDESLDSASTPSVVEAIATKIKIIDEIAESKLTIQETSILEIEEVLAME